MTVTITTYMVYRYADVPDDRLDVVVEFAARINRDQGVTRWVSNAQNARLFGMNLAVTVARLNEGHVLEVKTPLKS